MEKYAVFLISLSYTPGGQRWGRLTDPADGKTYDFTDLTEAVLKMEETLDEKMCPREPSPLRTLGQPGRKRENRYVPPKSGNCLKEQFYIRIFYRQNSSWQGELRCQNKDEKVCFRSVLELLKLLDSAVEIRI